MPKHLIRRYLPSPESIAALPMLGRFAPHLADPRLWHLNRHTVAGAVYWGLFCSFLPMPMQFLPAALGAIFFRVNLPVSVALVWLSNPLTMIPLLYVAYAIGAAVLGEPMIHISQITQLFTQCINWILGEAQNPFDNTQSAQLLKPLMVGWIIEAVVVSLVGGALTKVLWRWHVIHHWQYRHRLPKSDQSSDSD